MSIVKLLVFLKFFIVVLFFSYSSSAKNNKETDAVAQSYVNLVSHYYDEVYVRTNNMHKSINMFLKYPTEENLQNVKKTWHI